MAYALKYNPFIDNLQYITKNDFLPWSSVPAGSSLEVSANRQMNIVGELVVLGELVLLGQLNLLYDNIAWAYRAITANYTLGANGAFDELVNVTANSITVTIPTAVNYSRQYTVKNSGTGVVTLNTTASQTIDDEASGTLTLQQYDAITLRSNGSNWIII